MKRIIKRILIIMVYLAIFSILAYGFYLLVKPDPSCFDKKRNQNEEKTDCGGVCQPCEKIIQTQPITIVEKDYVYGGQGKYDVFAKFSNPNYQFGSPNFTYEFILRDSGGQELAKRSGKSFILPAETKNVIEIGLVADSIPQEIEVRIIDAAWQEFIEFEKPQIGIYNKRYSLISSGTGYSEAYGLVRNESPFDFNMIKVKIVLRDALGKALALNSTEMRTVNSRDERDFRLVWPTVFPGDVSQVDMEAEADIYDSQNFIKKFLPGE